MKVLVLGGCGVQGRTALYDLANNSDVKEVFCADIRFDDLGKIKDFVDMAKINPVKVDAGNSDELKNLFQQADVVIDLLPANFKGIVCNAAFATGTNVVNTNYSSPIAGLDSQAKAADVIIMSECGLDPGIDLIIYNRAMQYFDEIHVINSYCGGFPEKTACNNPLSYKVSWIWEGVLNSCRRDSRIIKDGQVFSIPGDDQHEARHIHTVDFPGLGSLEAIPNGDAVYFAELLGIRETIRDTGRYSLRWPGWSAFWHPLKQLDFLSREPVPGLPCEVSPHQFLSKFLEPKLQYEDDEKDLVAMVNIFEGLRGQRKVRLTSRMLIERDLDTGLMAMSKGVGYSASIVAQMIARGEITDRGILTPTTAVPWQPFLKELTDRGIVIEEQETKL